MVYNVYKRTVQYSVLYHCTMLMYYASASIVTYLSRIRVRFLARSPLVGTRRYVVESTQPYELMRLKCRPVLRRQQRQRQRQERRRTLKYKIPSPSCSSLPLPSPARFKMCYQCSVYIPRSGRVLLYCTSLHRVNHPPTTLDDQSSPLQYSTYITSQCSTAHPYLTDRGWITSPHRGFPYISVPSRLIPAYRGREECSIPYA